MLWEIFALRYGTHGDRTAAQNFMVAPDPHDRPMPLDYYVWLLRAGDREIVVDTGFRTEARLKGGRKILRPVGDALQNLGVRPESVRDVIITHLHYDHAGNLDLFPHATFHLQEREMSFATGRNMCVACLRQAFEVEDVVAMVRALYSDRVTFHDGDSGVADGVTVHHVGGHTDGLQMVRVETARGPVVLASDASHFYANMREGLPFPILYNLGDMARGWARAVALAGGDVQRVVPGHDPLVRLIYPAVEGSDGETVTLHREPVAMPEEV